MLENARDRLLEPENNEQKSVEAVVGCVLHGRFLVERNLTDRNLGTGFSSFLVKDLKNFCDKAILKIVASSFDRDAESGPSFPEVCSALGRLGHPNIEPVIETGRLFDERPFAIMEFSPGETLDRVISGGKRLELEAVADILKQTAQAMAAVHSRRILHCDLRSSNILVLNGDGDAGKVRVINFGSAWPVDVRGENLANVTPGTESLYYAAPELLIKLGHRSPASDIYSFCALAYRLITGSVPFEGNDRLSLLEMINSGVVVSPAADRTNLSQQAAEMILAGLRFEPAWRPQNIGEFGVRLVRAICPPKSLSMTEPPTLPETEPTLPVQPVVQSESTPRLKEKTDFVPTFLKPPKKSRIAVSDRAIAWALIILLMSGALTIPIGQTLLSDRNKATAAGTLIERQPETAAKRQIRYKLEPPRLRGRNLASSAAQSYVKGGQLTLASDAAGYLYVFMETEGDDGRPHYRVIYPLTNPIEEARETEAGKSVTATLPEDRQFPKAIWIAWTKARNTELEAVRASAAEGETLGSEDGRKLRHFLERTRKQRVEASVDETAGQTILNGSGDKMVYRIEIGEQ